MSISGVANPGVLPMYAPFPATARSNICAAPRPREGSVVGRYGLSVRDINARPRMTAPLARDFSVAAGRAPRLPAARHFAVAAGGAPRLPAARCSPTRKGFLLVPTETASKHLLPAARSRNALYLQPRCGKNAPPPSEIQCVCSVVIKLSKKLAKEVLRMAGLLLQWTRPEIRKVQNICLKWIEWIKKWMETNKVDAKVLRTITHICSQVVSATDERPSDNGHCRKNPFPPTETTQCLCSVLSYLSRKVVMMGSLLMQFIHHMRAWTSTRIIIEIHLVSDDINKHPATAEPSTPKSTSTAEPSTTRRSSTAETSTARCSSTSGSATAESNLQAQSDSTSSQQPSLMSKAKKALNKVARKLWRFLIRLRLERVIKDLTSIFIKNTMICLAVGMCYLACKDRENIYDKAVACGLLAMECKAAILRYDLPEKAKIAGALVRYYVLRAIEVCKEAEKVYKVSEKLLVTWMKVQEGGKFAETLATTWANLEKGLMVLRKLSKGAGKLP